MIWPILEARAEIQKYFRSFLVQMKASKSHSEIIWPLVCLESVFYTNSTKLYNFFYQWNRIAIVKCFNHWQARRYHSGCQGLRLSFCKLVLVPSKRTTHFHFIYWSSLIFNSFTSSFLIELSGNKISSFLSS